MKKYDANSEVIWKDRKRFMGMPLSFTRYSIIKKDGAFAKLVNVNGLLTTSTEEVNLYRVDDVSIYRSLFDKIFGVGTITVYCNDATCDKLVLKKVKNPNKVREILDQLVIEDRRRMGVRQLETQY